MKKSYRLKCYANKSKTKKLNALFAHWQDQVNCKIKIFWKFKEIKGSYPSKEYTLGGRLIRDASVKAWQIVKGAKKIKQLHRPYFTGNEIDLNQHSAYIIADFQTDWKVSRLSKWILHILPNVVRCADLRTRRIDKDRCFYVFGVAIGKMLT